MPDQPEDPINYEMKIPPVPKNGKRQDTGGKPEPFDEADQSDAEANTHPQPGARNGE